ncbi:hypothetical protein [Polycyclovorans algicola]|uniref:hypothetical protein n=1 Tax=Polycyclovorans algicola TaxID=616992 RepID=UPI00126841E9|nr:hypothetical protein [Polycyclovorans algicola]
MLDLDPTIGNLMVRSLTSGKCGRGAPKEIVEERRALLKSVWPSLLEGGVALQKFLISLGQDKRHQLMACAVPELRILLTAATGGLDVNGSPPQAAVVVPENLPEDLENGLRGFLDALTRRLDTLVENGHQRHRRYLVRAMAEPIRLASFLAAQGDTRWTAATSSLMVRFARQYPRHDPVKLAPFLAFIRSEDRFRKRVALKPKKKAVKFLRSARLPDVYQPDQLQQKLNDAKARLKPEEFLLYWMVARLGMTARAAVGICLDQLHVTPEGALVIRPAEGWVRVPKSVAPTLRRYAISAAPGWPFDHVEKGSGIPFLSPISTDARLSSEICQGESKKLRLSAAFAAIKAGYHDRSTLKAHMGISLPILERLEFLMAADLHMVVDPDIVEARNAVIRGERDA